MRSYGVVHLCIDKATGHKKAAKIMPKVRAKQSPERTQRKLEREVALMTRISRESKAVAQLVDVFEDKSYVYIVMDLLEGGDLEQLLEVRGPSLHISNTRCKEYFFSVKDWQEASKLTLKPNLQAHGAFSERAAAVTTYECLKIISVCHANGEFLSVPPPIADCEHEVDSNGLWQWLTFRYLTVTLLLSVSS